MGNRPPQRTVREGQFNRALDIMNFEMAQKTAKSMAAFHAAYVAPLERRILLIETITGIRLVRWIRWTLYRGWRWVRGKILAGWHRFYMWATEAIPEEVKEPSPLDHLEEGTVVAMIDEEPEPEPEDDGVSRILSLGD